MSNFMNNNFSQPGSYKMVEKHRTDMMDIKRTPFTVTNGTLYIGMLHDTETAISDVIEDTPTKLVTMDNERSRMIYTTDGKNYIWVIQRLIRWHI